MAWHSRDDILQDLLQTVDDQFWLEAACSSALLFDQLDQPFFQDVDLNAILCSDHREPKTGHAEHLQASLRPAKHLDRSASSLEVNKGWPSNIIQLTTEQVQQGTEVVVRPAATSINTSDALNNQRTQMSICKSMIRTSHILYGTNTMATRQTPSSSTRTSAKTKTSSPRRHKCPHCGRELSSSSNLNKHIKDIHGNIRHPCEKGCGKDFSRNHYRRQHEKKCGSVNSLRDISCAPKRNGRGDRIPG